MLATLPAFARPAFARPSHTLDTTANDRAIAEDAPAKDAHRKVLRAPRLPIVVSLPLGYEVNDGIQRMRGDAMLFGEAYVAARFAQGAYSL